MSSLQTSLADLATTIPSSTRVFLRHRLDFCCGGKRSLAEACGEAKLDPQRVFDEITAESTRDTTSQRRWDDCPLGDIIDHIVQHYHAPLRTDLPLLIELARKVERVHEKRQACPRGLAEVLVAMLADLEHHMRKEELILFPLIRDGRGSDAGVPISVLEREHQQHGAELQRIRELTGDLVIPEEACRSWRALYDGLARLETDLMEHIHLENNVLFRRALAA
jgi:regulator of cell morphogenesis and NO signaling